MPQRGYLPRYLRQPRVNYTQSLNIRIWSANPVEELCTRCDLYIEVIDWLQAHLYQLKKLYEGHLCQSEGLAFLPFLLLALRQSGVQIPVHVGMELSNLKNLKGIRVIQGGDDLH